jgi:tetratricopeptide (TPR) repeat protein
MLYKDRKLAGNVNDYKTEEEFLRFKLPVKSTLQKVETFTISINDISITSANIVLAWENTSVSFNVSAEVDSKVMKNIETNMASDKPAYFQAASYYYDNGKDLSKALEWVNKAIESNQKAYWMMMLKSRIQYKMGDYAGASASAEQVIILAKDAKNEEYIKNGEKMLSDIKNVK